MFRLIDGLPDNVVGVEAVGEVHSEDYRSVLDPAVDAAAAAHEKIRFLYVLGADFEGYSGGAMWEDTKVGVANWSKWEKIALVTDSRGYADGVKAFSWMLPGDVKVYPTANLEEAKGWIVG